MTPPPALSEADNGNGNGAFKAVTSAEIAALKRDIADVRAAQDKMLAAQHATDLAVARITERLSLWAGALAVMQVILAALAAYVGRTP